MKKKILVIFFVSIFLFLSYNTYKIYKYRQHPNYKFFEQQFGINSNILNYYNRFLIFIKGSETYNKEFFEFLTRCHLKQDILNRYISKKTFLKLNDKVFLTKFHLYNFNKNDLTNSLTKRLSKDKNCLLLDKNNLFIDEYQDFYPALIEIFNDNIDDIDLNNSEIKEIFGNFEESENEINENIKKDVIKHYEDTFINYYKNIHYSLENNKLKEALSRCSYKIINNVENINKKILKELKKNQDLSHVKNNSLTHLIFTTLKVNTTKSTNLLKKIITKNNYIPKILVLKFLDSESLEEYNLIKNYFISHINLYNTDIIQNIIFSMKNKSRIINIFNELTNIKNENAIFVFHVILNKFPNEIEKISNKILKNKDSIIKKGIIAMLVKHNFSIGKDHINDLFNGEAPRIIALRTEDYIESKACNDYIQIAQHDYLEVGKKFPPIYCNKPLNNEIELWKNYIEEYPWFPSTDDAYYRLIFKLVIENHINDALKYIKKYEQTKLSDTDSTEFIYMIKTMILNNKISNFKINVKNCKEEIEW